MYFKGFSETKFGLTIKYYSHPQYPFLWNQLLFFHSIFVGSQNSAAFILYYYLSNIYSIKFRDKLIFLWITFFHMQRQRNKKSLYIFLGFFNPFSSLSIVPFILSFLVSSLLAVTIHSTYSFLLVKESV